MSDRPVRTTTSALVVALWLAAFGAATAQVKAPDSFEAPYRKASTKVDNSTNEVRMVWQHLVEIPYAGWLQLKFADYALPGSSYVEITSFKDGAKQRLDRAMMQRWFPRSAYFNGDALMVRLFAGPDTTDVHLDLAATVVGVAPTGKDTICGPTDDRVNSNDPRTCRLLPIGCTAWIATPNGLLLTAGHCLGGSNPIVQFNVPQSTSGGTLQHPPPQDQYTVLQELAGVGNGTGCDWGIMLAGTNSQNQTPLQRQNAFFVLRTVAPGASDTIRITGYGSASGSRNQTQKTHIGPFTTLGNGASCNGAYRLQYQTDTTGGNSGSPVIDEATNQAIGIHTHGGCNSNGSGANSGTFLLNADFQRALNAPIPQPPGPLAPGHLVLSDEGTFDSLVQIDTSTFGSQPISGRFYTRANAVTMATDNSSMVVLQSGTFGTFANELLSVANNGATSTIATFGSSIGGVHGVDLGQDGNWVVVAGDNQVRRVSPAGAVSVIGTLPGTTNAVTHDHETGNLLVVTTGGQLLEVSHTGALLRTVASGLGQAAGVDVSPTTGHIVVITSSGPHVRTISRAGATVSSFSLTNASGVKVDDSTGNYLCTHGDAATAFTPTGTAITSYGPVRGLTATGIEIYGSRAVSGRGSAQPGTNYSVDFAFPSMPGANYQGALSLGQRPGISVGSDTIHLRIDTLFNLSLVGTFVSNFAGTLDGAGTATGAIVIPAGAPVGLTIYCAAIAFQGSQLRVSNTIGVTLR